jgi:hypothetical protein
MTDGQHRALGHIFQAFGLIVSSVFAWAELSGRPSPLPDVMMLLAILSMLAAWVFFGLADNL